MIPRRRRPCLRAHHRTLPDKLEPIAARSSRLGMTVAPTIVSAAAHSGQYYKRQRLLRQFIGPSRGVDGLLFAVNSMQSSERGEKKVNLKEALEEIRDEYQNDAVVITSEHDRVLDDFIGETDGGHE